MDILAAGFICLIPIAIIVVNILLALWVYKDAKKRGENEVMWLIVFLVGGIIGLIIWLIVRPEVIHNRESKEEWNEDWNK